MNVASDSWAEPALQSMFSRYPGVRGGGEYLGCNTHTLLVVSRFYAHAFLCSVSNAAVKIVAIYLSAWNIVSVATCLRCIIPSFCFC